MSLFSQTEQRFVSVLGRLIDCNPFLPERMTLEKAALGRAFMQADANWTLDPMTYRRSENVIRIAEKAEAIVTAKRSRLAGADKWSAEEAQRYADLVDYVMFSRLVSRFTDNVDGAQLAKIYAQFRQELAEMQPQRLESLGDRSASHLFAIYNQLFRAFRNIFDHLVGNSAPIIALRAEVWRSIFTHSIRRYRERLYARMRDFSTLITGPSGTGKELVARAIGLSSYIPYADERSRTQLPSTSFLPINLSALSPTLIESELFGHTKGAYTGAVAQRKGWLEACPEYGSVFLDEIGELQQSIQVKLLRVLQERTFQRLGDTQEHLFRGKIVAATNRDLAAQMESGEFRSDFYYRICSDQIQVPSLAERCQSNPTELAHLVAHLLQRVLQEDATSVADDVLGWIEQHLGAGYAWPGNVRELDQCIRSWLIRKNYRPARSPQQSVQLKSLLSTATCTAEELVSLYCAAKHEALGSYQAVGQLLQVDRRTVKARLEQLRNQSPPGGPEE